MSLHSEILLRLIRLVQTASKLITSDIKLVETEKNCYPSYGDFESQDKCISFLPETENRLRY